ncbi:MAG: alpha/beta fold hydrolase [Actinobacteria bacterium]|nr:MAG: alpha/beta fold hydrolase [Actinomycetota bacterium]
MTVAQHVADLAAAVDAPATVIGWSWGAMLGLAFAAAHPELVRALVLIGCGTFDAAGRALYDAAIHERGDDRPLRPRGADTRHGRSPAHATSSSWRCARGSQPTPDTAAVFGPVNAP